MAKARARDAGARSWADIGKHLGIHSNKTADAYRDVWRICFKHARAVYKVRDITKLSSEHVQSFLHSKIHDGISRATYDQYASALGKLENALILFAEKHNSDQNYDIRSGIEATRSDAKSLAKFSGTRAYERPEEIVTNIRSKSNESDFQLAAQLQLEGGSRVHEISLIKPEQLCAEDCSFVCKGKGGKFLSPQLSEETFTALANHIEKHGVFSINKDQYRGALQQAAEDTGQPYTGSHGLRWNFAQNRMQELHRGGTGYYASLAQVSQEMGHERPSITKH